MDTLAPLLAPGNPLSLAHITKIRYLDRLSSQAQLEECRADPSFSEAPLCGIFPTGRAHSYYGLLDLPYSVGCSFRLARFESVKPEGALILVLFHRVEPDGLRINLDRFRIETQKHFLRSLTREERCR